MFRFIRRNCYRGRFARALALCTGAANNLLRGLCLLVALGGGSAMSVSNGIISLTDVRDMADIMATLGVSDGRHSYLCSNAHGKINMWSRCKPIHIANTNFPDRSGKWWRGADGTCGLVQQIINGGYGGIIDVLNSSDMLRGWSYIPPWGGAASPYRIADLNGYYLNAQPPIQNFAVMSEVVEGGRLIGSCIINGDQSANPGSLSIYDVHIGGKPLADWKLGMLITDAKGNRKGRVVSSGLGAAEFNIGLLPTGATYYAYPFIAENEMGQNDSDIANTYYAIPYTTKQEFKVISKAESVGIRISFVGIDNLGVNWTLKITVEKDLQVYAGSVSLRFAESGEFDDLQMGEYQTSLGEFNITSTTPYNRTGSFMRADTSAHSYVLRLYLRTSAGEFRQESGILSQSHN